MLKLRPYQEQCVQSILDNYQKGFNRQLVSMATGAGKTVCFASLIHATGLRSLVIAHTNELLEQSRDKIKMISPALQVGILNAESKEFNAPVVVASIQSACQPKNLEELKSKNFGLLIYDECHHAAADTSRAVINDLGFGKGTKRLLCGFTATPFRQDSKGLAEVFDVIAYEKSIKDMVSEGYLSQPKGIKVSTDIDLSKVKMGDGDFQADSLAKVMDVPEIRQIVIEAYLKNGDGRQAICFGVTVQNAYNLAMLFKQHGIAAEAIHGGMLKKERESVLAGYRSGEINVLCNCQLLIEGFDAPETSCVIVARPTQSKGLYQQMVGRGLRLWPGKQNCLIFDFCTKHHSLCNSATLLEDDDDEQSEEKEERNRQREIRANLPPNLNQKLKAAIVSFDPLGEAFTWNLNDNQVFVLKGNNVRLGIVPSGDNRYRVICASEKGNQTIADGLNFEYAFASAEDYAKANRSLFIVNDRQAGWRDLPASEKQIACIRASGYRAGIENLTRGQASDLIASGRLRKTG